MVRTDAAFHFAQALRQPPDKDLTAHSWPGRYESRAEERRLQNLAVDCSLFLATTLLVTLCWQSALFYVINFIQRSTGNDGN